MRNGAAIEVDDSTFGKQTSLKRRAAVGRWNMTKAPEGHV